MPSLPVLHQHLEVLAVPAPTQANPDQAAFRKLFVALAETREYRDFSAPPGPMPFAMYRNGEDDFVSISPRGVEMAVPNSVASQAEVVENVLCLARTELGISGFVACAASVSIVASAPGGSAVEWLAGTFLREKRHLEGYGPFGVTFQKTDTIVDTRLRLERRFNSDAELWMRFEIEVGPVSPDRSVESVVEAALDETGRLLRWIEQ